MTAPTAILFPGQGNAPRDMGERVRAVDAELHDATIAAAGADVFERADDGPRWMQPALLAMILAGWRRLERLVDAGHVELDFGDVVGYAGHSLGELAALTAAGSLEMADAIDVAALRGRLYEQVEAGGREAAMCAIVGEGAHEFVEPQLSDQLYLANDNSPLQVVVSGSPEAVAELRKSARAEGLRAVTMYMKFAAHTPWVREVVEPMRERIADAAPKEPRAPVWSSTLARPFEDVAAEVAEGCARTVRWRELLLGLHERGARRYIDVGPGHVMAGLAYKTLGADVQTPTVEDLEEQVS